MGAPRGNQNRLGKPCSEETKRKISEAKRGVKTGTQPAETIQKIKDAWTPEKRTEISAQRRGMRYGEPASGVKSRNHQNSYVVLTGQWEHPISVKGVLAEHRKVLYNRIGPGPHLCHWGCGRALRWGGLKGTVADHLDGDITNNTPDNLVPSCNMCNIHRKAG